MRLRRLAQWPMQRGLVMMGRWSNHYLVRGLHPTGKINGERFLRARYWSIATDYVRNGTLELICRELQSVPGSIAEVGVYQGDFAALMHHHLPDRRVHLFDTFEGFDARDRQFDVSKSYVAKFHDFANTSMALVKRKFPPDAAVVFHPGWFPQTASEVAKNELFALVSLDADLYQPILAGMQWFWPRMAPGGYIMVHDYNNNTFQGAKQAVRDFARKEGVPYCPIPDAGGTAVFGKPLQQPLTVSASLAPQLRGLHARAGAAAAIVTKTTGPQSNGFADCSDL